MTRPRLAALLLLAAAGCRHARTTDRETASPSSPPAPATKKAERAHTGERAKPRADEPSAIPVASSAAALLEPGAEKKIRDKLDAAGFLKESPGEPRGALDAALRRFQGAHDLPATGQPDVETVRKLGLDPDDIFRRAANAPN
jgi:hypothetical protein